MFWSSFMQFTQIHRTKVGSHEAVALHVVPDNSIPHIDPKCMKVVFPTEVASSLLKEVTYEKNVAHNRFKYQLILLKFQEIVFL